MLGVGHYCREGLKTLAQKPQMGTSEIMQNTMSMSACGVEWCAPLCVGQYLPYFTLYILHLRLQEHGLGLLRV